MSVNLDGGCFPQPIFGLGTLCIQTLDFANNPAGTFTLGFTLPNGVVKTTNPISFSATIATLLASIQAACDALLGKNFVVASGTVITAVSMTFSYAGPQTLIIATVTNLRGGTCSVTSSTAGVAGAAFQSADQHSAAAPITNAPVATGANGAVLVVTDLIISVGTTMTLTFTEETTGTIILVVIMLASTTVVISPTGRIPLYTAGKRLFVEASVSGNVNITPVYYSQNL
jgi:hypothetical protein